MKNLTTVLDFIRYCTTQLSQHVIYYGHGTNSALDEAAALVIGLLELPFDIDTMYLQTHLTDEEKVQILIALEKRIHERVPVPYLTQRTLYGGYEFYIDERALIPRSPIAELIENGLSLYWQSTAPERILDLCCGSGCIGMLAKYHYPEAEIVLADIDNDALAVAQENLQRTGMEGFGIETRQSDGFNNIEGQFDWILCNPPYVENAELVEIADEFLHEPRQALVSGEDGLMLTRRLLAEAADYLRDNGVLVLEVGMSWQNLENAYPNIGFDWVTFERGGEGVFAVCRDELLAWREAGLLT